MKILLLFLLTIQSCWATDIKEYKILVKESFRDFDNETLTLKNRNAKYFNYSGGVYGLGNNDLNMQPIFTLFKNARLSLDYQQVENEFTHYENFSWIVVFKTPERAILTFSDDIVDINPQTIQFMPHRINGDGTGQYKYVVTFAQSLNIPSHAYFIERTVIAGYPYTDPLLIDSIYITGVKKNVIDDGCYEDDKEIRAFLFQNKKIKVITESTCTLEFEIFKPTTGESMMKTILHEQESDIPVDVLQGIYMIMITDTERRVLQLKKIYIY